MDLPVASYAVSRFLTLPSLGWEGTKGRVKYPAFMLITPT